MGAEAEIPAEAWADQPLELKVELE
jgi:hypothetical protein